MHIIKNGTYTEDPPTHTENRDEKDERPDDAPGIFRSKHTKVSVKITRFGMVDVATAALTRSSLSFLCKRQQNHRVRGWLV